MDDAKCMGTCQYTDLCRFGVSDIASAGGIGHDSNCVTHGLTCHKIGLDGFACVSTASLASSSALGCSLACSLSPSANKSHISKSHGARLPHHQAEPQGRQFRSDGAPQQGQNNTLRSFMATVCQMHVSASLETEPIPSVAKHLLITVAYIDSVLSLSPTQALLFQKRHF